MFQGYKWATGFLEIERNDKTYYYFCGLFELEMMNNGDWYSSFIYWKWIIYLNWQFGTILVVTWLQCTENEQDMKEIWVYLT